MVGHPQLRKINNLFNERRLPFILIFLKEEMNLAEYKSNSHKLRDGTPEPEEKKLAPVISGTAVTQKKSGFSKFADSIIAEDLASVGNYILADVLVPAFKKTIADIVTNGIDILLYGKTGVSKSGTNASKISYGSYYQRSYNEPIRANQSASVFDYDNIIFDNRGDAEAVLSSMDELLDQFGIVSVADFYELSNVPCPNYTANKYGWINIRNAQVLRARDGYIIKLPRAQVLN